MSIKITDEPKMGIPSVGGYGKNSADKYGFYTHAPGENWVVSDPEEESAEVFANRVRACAVQHTLRKRGKFVTRTAYDDDGVAIGLRVWRIE